LAYDPRYFAWYELMTTDAAGAAAFYCEVVGWGTQEAATSKMPYKLFTIGGATAAGVMELPDEASKMGARPMWTGYVRVTDVHATVERIRQLGGAVYVPPTDSNIGPVSVVADPFAATFGLVGHHLRVRPQAPAESSKLGRVGWHELLAADLDKEGAFYCALFGWQKTDTDDHLMDAYLRFSAGGHAIGGAFRKSPQEPVPFWLLYFNVDDLDAAVQRVRAGGGKAFRSDEELPGGLSVAHCADPQGAAFALQGKPGQAAKLGWSAEWRGFTARGQLVMPTRRRDSSE
jgi:uncharacterized protein